MAWNEPGGSGKDPWGGPGRDQGPPDLDEAIKKLQQRLSGVFGGGSSGGGSAAGGKAAGVAVLILLAVWALSGIYIVEPAERGVVTRFGAYVETTMPGPHWHFPYPIEKVEIVNVDNIRTVEIGYRSGGRGKAGGSVPSESLMLTQDENIVDVQFAIQYRVKDPKDYLFNVRNPDATLHQVAESAIREVIGKSKMDFVLTQGRSEISDRVEQLTQEILDRYGAGLLVSSVNMQSAQPPREVKAAFDDAIKAREDEQRFKNEAEAYANDIIPKARGAAARMLEEASAYKERVVAQAEGEANRFEALLAEYKRAPEVTRERLYLESLEAVLSKTSKVMVDVDGGNSLLYLPLDRLGVGGEGRKLAPGMLPSMSSPQTQSLPQRSGNSDLRRRDNLRSRERP